MDEGNLRILWISENYYPQKGGMAESCDRIVSGLRKLGHVVDVAGVSKSTAHLEVQERKNGRDILVSAEEQAPHALNRIWNQVERFHREAPYEAVIAFGGTLPLIAGPVYARWLALPLITCIRGNDFDTAVFSPNKRWILESCLNSSELICAVSKDKVERITALFPHLQVAYVPNGIDTKQWQALPADVQRASELRQERGSGTKFVFGIFGQLKAKKGLDFLLRALATFPSPEEIHLVLVGEAQTESLEIQFPCTFTHVPFQDRFNLIPYYLSCDCVVIPSLYDGLPNVLLEAGSLGKLCCASSVGGSADVLEDHPELLFPPDNVSECRMRLLDIVRLSPTEREKLGSELSKHVENQFSAEKEILLYSSLLYSCCRKTLFLSRELLQ